MNLTATCSAVIKRGLPKKMKDPGSFTIVDLTKTHIRVYDTITIGLLSNPWHRCHKTC